ncbi:hypothetical protein M422DRAFT_85668, partial [Sphaerobolus stellatus SS14]
QGASTFMYDFKQELDTLISGIFQHEAPTPHEIKCACGDMATHRCMDCWLQPRLCQSCLLQAHRSNPLHRISIWADNYFKKADLFSLGLVLGLAHEGSAVCPNLKLGKEPRKVDVVHINGHHTIAIHYCQCPGAGDPILQLCRAGLFPATVKDPTRIGTVFTFAVLKEFQIHQLTSKKSAYDFCEGLVRHTDMQSPNLGKSKYNEFLRVSRVWNHLSTLKRSGQLHGIDKLLPHRTSGSTAVRCPACPEEHFNLASNFIKEEDGTKYINIKWISVDGNHSARRLKKRHDPNDTALSGGTAYCVDDDTYQAYLKKVVDSHEVYYIFLIIPPKSTCANLSAAKMQNKAKFKNCEVTGIAGVICARHGFIQPGGVADLQLGEKYCNVDYALAGALRETP